jgi:hypothetical protein
VVHGHEVVAQNCSVERHLRLLLGIVVCAKILPTPESAG